MPLALPTDHQLCRMLTWVRVWLTMALSVLPARGGMGPFVGWLVPELEARVCQARALVLHILFLLAFKRAPRRLAKFGHGHRVAKFGHLHFRYRVAVGHRLVRRRRGVRAEIEALLALVRDPEPIVARLVRRLTRGLIRRVKRARVPAALLLASAFAPSPIAANSS